MSPEFSETASHWHRAVIVLLVLAVLCVPPLVRATDSLKQSPTPLLRLNRGFSAPETKSKLTPPPARPLDAPVADQTAPLQTAHAAAPVLNETIPAQPSDRSPSSTRRTASRI